MRVVMASALALLCVASGAAAQFREDTRTLSECLALDDESGVKECAQSYRNRACTRPYAQQQRQPSESTFDMAACVGSGAKRTAEQDALRFNDCQVQSSQHDATARQSSADRLQQCAQDVQTRTAARASPLSRNDPVVLARNDPPVPTVGGIAG
jgi:hypothetical protein